MPGAKGAAWEGCSSLTDWAHQRKRRHEELRREKGEGGFFLFFSWPRWVHKVAADKWYQSEAMSLARCHSRLAAKIDTGACRSHCRPSAGGAPAVNHSLSA
ncbi:hypothetical protein E2562_025939 [Oryza meyeriana var. granulata]|uniref:Uncharacterized protein n=1 Tax=Oryza meyeriana var. granulata TaxID=110450 RepID=A0A6G1EYW2_9ORYZ|nr:hypothetical protein E2562_025939 [Oryza meyeriana var. granulata]